MESEIHFIIEGGRPLKFVRIAGEPTGEPIETVVEAAPWDDAVVAERHRRKQNSYL
jgi:hypothetical protein